MDAPVYVGFTSFRNEKWISFGPPSSKDAQGHAIRWKIDEHWRELALVDQNVDAAIQLRQRIIIRTGEAPRVTNASVDNMLLQLVQLALKDNLI